MDGDTHSGAVKLSNGRRSFIMAFLTSIVSQVGGRDHNEDFCNFAEIGGVGCWVVADGLGGHRGGELASKSAVDAALESFATTPQVSEQALKNHMEAAQRAVVNAQTQQPSFSTMRTTIVVLIADSTRALWAHMGDSRLYYFENGSVAFQTKDHSVVQMMADAGDISAEQIRHHEDRNRILRSLGDLKADFLPTFLPKARTLSRGSSFLLCTDGFWENVLEAEMMVDLAKAADPEQWLVLMEDRLLERSSDGDDNYTGVAVLVA
jgi:serine/threonine protein phosphatase PrpC